MTTHFPAVTAKAGKSARCESVVNAPELIPCGEAYHYHSKLIMQDARTGGAWACHQDDGY